MINSVNLNGNLNIQQTKTSKKNDANFSQNQYPTTTYTKPTIGQKIGGFILGWCGGNLIGNGLGIFNFPAITKINSYSKNLTPIQKQEINTAIEKSLKEPELNKQNIKIITYNKNLEDSIKKMAINDLNADTIRKFLPKTIKENQAKQAITQLDIGVNAFYSPSENKIIIPQKGFELAKFHEVGHALNKHASEIGKTLQKMRGLQALALPIMFISLCKTKKAENEKPKGAFDKITTFIKENAGKLAFACWIPVLLEEGLASINGNKLAKKFLSPDLAKKVAKNNLICYSTYIVTAIGASIGVNLANKIKDSIAKPKAKQIMPQMNKSHSLKTTQL